MNLIQSELIKKGKNEFFNENQLSFFDDRFAFIKKVMNYDDDIHEIVTEKIFVGFTFSTPEIDKDFKRMFINRFLVAEIQGQTIEDFGNRVVYTTLSLSKYIENVYKNIDKFMNGQSESETSNSGTGLTDFRNLMSSLPQDNINLNVDDTILNYGDTNTINRTKNKNDGKSNTVSNTYNIDNLLKAQDIFIKILNEYDRRCFLQTW